ncbi:lysozyme [Paroceanicella profunda]|uniref:Lysozyme n=1 Tax=Paroceanicella profunda TaxID=2579971 RepID=A0A5B8FY15_9RHOB|nr:lysozyme [Paroceanicella profunda]QDL91489.1 lysozyme [Paroceanicella profunda]
MRTSLHGVAALAAHEGIVPAPYRDSAGVWTFGIGHTASAGGPDPATLPRGMPADLDAALRRAVETFRADLALCEARVLAAVPVPLAPHEFDALVSFDFNTGGIDRAHLVTRLNAGDRQGAARAFDTWHKPPEIIPRRDAERELFRTGRYPEAPVPVWRADTSGRLRGVLRAMPVPELLALVAPGPAEPEPEPEPPAPRPSVLSRLIAWLKGS